MSLFSAFDDDYADKTMIDLGGGMAVPLSELLEDEEDRFENGERFTQFDTVEEDRGER